jgi:Tfp pilus assembly protein PilO
MAVVGEYHDVGRFLSEIASLSRIVTPVQVDVQLYGQPQQFPDLESPVLANFRIETYVLPDPSAAPPSAAAPPA